LNTPAHAIINSAILRRGKFANEPLAIFVGAVLPDLPMFLFYAYARLAMGLNDGVVWSQTYFEPGWQRLFDWFHSFPLALLLIVIGIAARKNWLSAASLSAFGHSLLDFTLHHDDAHRHFLPLSNFRFSSPVSYWDPNHFGIWGALIEVVMVIGSVYIIGRRDKPRLQPVLWLIAAVYLFGYIAFYLL